MLFELCWHTLLITSPFLILQPNAGHNLIPFLLQILLCSLQQIYCLSFPYWQPPPEWFPSNRRNFWFSASWLRHHPTLWFRKKFGNQWTKFMLRKRREQNMEHNGTIWASCFEQMLFAAGSSRSKYICSRAVASHPRQTSCNKVNECARSMHRMNRAKPSKALVSQCQFLDSVWQCLCIFDLIKIKI